MRYMTQFVEAQLHREVYVAVLNGLLHTPGEKRAFSRRLGISPVYLSYLLALDDGHGNYPMMRVPSERIARRIADNLAAPAEIRDSVLMHMLLAGDKRVLAERDVQHDALNDNIPELCMAVVVCRNQAVFASDLEESRRLYRVAAKASASIMRRLNPQRYYLHYLDMAGLLCDCQHVLNRHDDVLWHTKQSCALIEHVYSFMDRQWRDHVIGHHMNMLRMQAVAYTALGDGRRALRLLEQALQLAPSIPDEVDWHALTLRDAINALASLPRFVIGEVEMLGQKASAVAQQSKLQAGLFQLLLAESLANAYLAHGNLRKASAILKEHEPVLDELTLIGPLHRLMFLRACARAQYVQGMRDGWKHYIGDAYRIAVSAGLTHQQVSIEQELQLRDPQLLIELKEAG
jgi:hypothetical protein